MNPNEALRHHVTGAIERGEAVPIVGIPAHITHNGWTLHYTIGDVVCGPVPLGDVVHLRDEESFRVTGGASPHKVNSTGRVYVTLVTDDGDGYDAEYFPSVIGARWINDETGGHA